MSRNEPTLTSTSEPNLAVSPDRQFQPLLQLVTKFLARISRQEWRRRALHMLPGFLPFILWMVYHRDPLSWDCRAYLALIIISIAAVTAVKYHRIARRGEVANSACIFGYTIPIFTLLIAVPEKAELGLTVLAILAMGDGSATVCGLLLRGPRLPWNAEKTWAGFIGFIAVGIPYSALIYWGEARPHVSFPLCLLISGVATILAAVCESLSSRIDDNVRVGVASAVGLILAQSIFGGW